MAARVEGAMWNRLFELSKERGHSLQTQIRRMLTLAIVDRHLAPGASIPSGRELAEQLGVSRNTVVMAYQRLVDEGLLVSRERSGYFVSDSAMKTFATPPSSTHTAGTVDGPRWADRFTVQPSTQRNISKPMDWQRYPYPFLYGQFDPALFPLAEWRECSRQALGILEVRNWAPDLIDGDDPLLIEELRKRVLPRRGVWAMSSEIMVTIGAQHALFLLAELLLNKRSVVGMEEPGYPDARNIFSVKTRNVMPLPVDAEGLPPRGRIADCDYVYVTPSHQCPTNATMPLDRRRALLDLARHRDFILIEDDYEAETNFNTMPSPALKSLDEGQRVVYVGSLSKSLAPGLRLGYIVAPVELIRETRALRRLMLRHPPANNQRAAALFLSIGHHEALLRRLTLVMRDRSVAMRRALEQHLPHCEHSPSSGGSSYWITGPKGLDARDLAERAKGRGVLIEPGDVFFMAERAPRNCFRLGFSSIGADKIEPGIAELGSLLQH